MNTKNQILDTALQLFNENGFSATPVSSIRKEAGVSNGSFFHAFSSKEDLGAELYLRALASYHDKVIASLMKDVNENEGIALMINAHLAWVVEERSQAMFLFDQSQPNWIEPIRNRQHEANDRLRKAISQWATPLIESGVLVKLPIDLFGAQLIGPTQIICRAWLSGRSKNDPRDNAELLIAAAQRALVRNSTSLA